MRSMSIIYNISIPDIIFMNVYVYSNNTIIYIDIIELRKKSNKNT